MTIESQLEQLKSQARCISCKTLMRFSPFLDDRIADAGSECTVCRRIASDVEEGIISQEEAGGRRNYPFNKRFFGKGSFLFDEFPPRLLEAKWKDVCPAIREGVSSHLGPMSEGAVLKKGFGLLGPIGCGKSAAVVGILSRYWTMRAMRLVGEGEKPLPQEPIKVAWVDWTETFSRLQRNATNSEKVDHIERKMLEAEILVLDDIGREALPRASDDGSTPFGMGILNLIITSRNARRKPILWTSNLTLSGHPANREVI